MKEYKIFPPKTTNFESEQFFTGYPETPDGFLTTNGKAAFSPEGEEDVTYWYDQNEEEDNIIPGVCASPSGKPDGMVVVADPEEVRKAGFVVV